MSADVIANETGIPNGLLANIIDAMLIEYVLNRHGAGWARGFDGKLILVPINLGLERL